MAARRLRSLPIRQEVAELAVDLSSGERLPVKVFRDHRARRLRLLVDDRGARLTVPRTASMTHARQFLSEHVDWLGARWQSTRPDIAAPSLRAFESSTLPLRGDPVAIAWQIARFSRITLQAQGLLFEVPSGVSSVRMRRALRDFYETEARADVGHWLPELLAGLPRPPSRFRFSPLRSIWGSLSHAGVVSLDLALVLAPPPVFHYVLVHELCHLIEPNHSPRFWRAVAQRCPQWQFQRAWLGRHGAALKAELGALLDVVEQGAV